MNTSEQNLPEYTLLLNLASERLGAKALSCSDDFFAEMDNLVKPGRGIFIADKYTDRGKWMDGWESRRKRGPGYDWCIISLGASGIIHGFDIDTNFFLGNHPPFASIEGARISDTTTDINSEKVKWTELLTKSPLLPGSQNFYECKNREIYTHLRLNIFPDGGVARLKVFGEVHKVWSTLKAGEVIDLASALNGAKAIVCNDMFFSHMDNILMPGRGINMGDGWETKRNRTPNNKDWLILRLAHKGKIQSALVDTAHFKGNYPDTCMLEGIAISTEEEKNITSDSLQWTELMPKQKLHADHEHHFVNEILPHDEITHVRLTIYPDGGVSRLRLFGQISN